MNIQLTRPKHLTLISFLLALPFTLLFLFFVLGLEPSVAPLAKMLGADESRLGSFIVFGKLLLLLISFIMNLRLLAGDVRTGVGITAHPLNLALSLVAFVFLVLFAAGIIVDQYPCWVGVPNCD